MDEEFMHHGFRPRNLTILILYSNRNIEEIYNIHDPAQIILNGTHCVKIHHTHDSN